MIGLLELVVVCFRALFGGLGACADVNNGVAITAAVLRASPLTTTASTCIVATLAQT